MGEYADRLSDGQHIKIGTCEDMLYLRRDQIDQVRYPFAGCLDAFRFRFPFPDEDTIAPGEFDDSDRSVPLYNVEVPDGVDHHKVQFIASYPKGHNVMLPCPLSPEGKASGLKYHANGFAGAVRIVQQRAWGGVWVTVAQCGGCNSRYRLPTLADALPLVEACVAIAERERINGDASRGLWYTAIGQRILTGYKTPVTAAS